MGDLRNVARTVGRYEILEELGRGGMATVYLARQAELDRLVALKELSALRQSEPAFVQRFLRESRLAGSLSHPNIVTVHDYFENAGTPYIAMEYVQRGSLRPHIGHMSLTQIAGVLEGVLAALAHAERHGIVHRDMKPENVMVTSEGRVKLTDFGIAKATGRLQTASVLTAAGSTVGTPKYMAPEQAMGQEVGPWTDLYSLGVMTFEFFVGHVPFAETEEPMAVLMRQVSDPIPPARSLNPELDQGISDWIERLVAKEPGERTRSAHEAWDQFEEIIIGLVGARWRRASLLLDPSDRPADAPAGPHTEPPTKAARPPLMPTLGVPDHPWTTLSKAPTRRLRDGEDAALARTVAPAPPARPPRHETKPTRVMKDGGRRRGALFLSKIALVLFLVLFAIAAALGRSGSGPASSSRQTRTPSQPAAQAPPAPQSAPQRTTPQTAPQQTAPQTAPQQSAPQPAPQPTGPGSDVGDSRSDDPSDDSAEP